MNYPEALRYLDSLANYENKDGYDYGSSFNLDRISKLCSFLGDPHRLVRSVHVAGSKGKGSTAAFIYSILRSSGATVGLYTSPHLTSFRERIRINDILISEEDVGRLLDIVRPAAEKLAKDPPTFFEVYTALAYLYFKQEDVDFAVYEVGMGGRLDATNMIEPLVSVITPISYEHTDKLGSTLREIAAEKAGIIKNGVPCVSAPQHGEALSVIEDKCRSAGSKLMLVGRDVLYRQISSDENNNIFSLSGGIGGYERISTKLLGSHQIVNAATAATAAGVLRAQGESISDDNIIKGIKSAEWPGRLEIACREPLTVLDGAHNGASAKALAESVKKLFKFRKLLLVLGVSKDKDIGAILEELLPISDAVVLTRSKLVNRAADPLVIKNSIRNFSGGVFLASDVASAVEKARSLSGESDMILIAGSLYIVGEARELLADSLNEIINENCK